MSQIPSSSRSILYNKTNVYPDGTLNPFFVPLKRSLEDANPEELKKRVRLSHDGLDDSDANTGDAEMDDVEPVKIPKVSVFSMIHNMYRLRPSAFSKQPNLSTRPILQTFVSSHKSDTYKCDSIRSDSHLTVPYACAYSHAAKQGGKPLLAVATEEGTIHVLDTSKRHDWDCEPQRAVLQPHTNGIFDVKWHHSDDLLATASGDLSAMVTSISGQVSVADLSGHTSTVKCVQWDPNHRDILCTGGRDGNIFLWDLRVGENGRQSNEQKTRYPVLIIPRAHDDITSKPGRRGKKLARSVTSLVYPEGKPFSLVSSGSSDSILREWDIRLPTRKTKSSPRKQSRPILTSPIDPTTASEDSRRARGITNVTSGIGPTQGLLFALGSDSQIRTYHAHTLDPLPYSTFSHTYLQSNSFYVKSSLSPCGRWLATGSAEGRAFLFDVSNAGKRRQMEGSTTGIELKGHIGEVGAIDWARDMLATCADDGTIRVWRPDIEAYNRCVREPKVEMWNWYWAGGTYI